MELRATADGDPEGPETASGVLDARWIDPSAGGALDLTGEWEFFPGGSASRRLFAVLVLI